MGLLDRLLIFWPIYIIICLLITVSGSIYGWTHDLRLIVIAFWIICIIRATFNTGYTTPSNWYLRSLMQCIVPSADTIGYNINDTSGFNHNRQAIYIWYPHSHFGMIPFNLIVQGMGSSIWKRPTTICAAPPFFGIPALHEISLSFGLVKNDYTSMKESLKGGPSMVIIPGGTKEVHLAKSGSMLLVDGRKGFLRLAQEFGLPIIPVFAFGENEFFEGRSAESSNIMHKLLKRAGGSFQCPSMKSILNWLQMEGACDAKIHLGSPFNCPAEASISELQGAWKSHVTTFYDGCRPAHYEAIEWITGKPK